MAQQQDGRSLALWQPGQPSLLFFYVGENQDVLFKPQVYFHLQLSLILINTRTSDEAGFLEQPQYEPVLLSLSHLTGELIESSN